MGSLRPRSGTQAMWPSVSFGPVHDGFRASCGRPTRRRIMRAAVHWSIILPAAFSVHANEKPAEFEEHLFASSGGEKMPYRLLRPVKVDAGKKYPVVLILHGWGEPRVGQQKKQLKDYGLAFSSPTFANDFPRSCSCLRQMGPGWRTLSSTRRQGSSKRRRTKSRSRSISSRRSRKNTSVDGPWMRYSNGRLMAWATRFRVWRRNTS